MIIMNDLTCVFMEKKRIGYTNFEALVRMSVGNDLSVRQIVGLLLQCSPDLVGTNQLILT